ncbi:MAG: hypothetical protein IKL94_03660 [Clostridia bacterium]|nr:hypothetical protein [Clostridia bacterium]
MKKKELINKIDSLVDTLNDVNAKLKACCEENAELKLKIEELSQEKKVDAKEPTEIIEPLKTVESQRQEPPKSSEIINEVKTEETSDFNDLSEKKTLNILPMGEKVILPDSIMEFGAEIIGKIVIESAKYADLVAASVSPDKKELLNLIMGKSEVCKAEILNIVTGSASNETKISLINSQLSEAVDYFKSVAAQI